jgi:CBS domain containing-hemolysin-like protein
VTFAFQAVLLVLLLALSAYFGLVEAAITALSPIRMKKLAMHSPRLRPLFQEWLAHPHRLLSVLLVGNNAVNIGFSSVAAVAAVPLHPFFPRVAVTWSVWFLVTVLLIVAGDILPKVAGRAYRERVAAWALPLLSRATRSLYFVWGPLGWALKKFAPAFKEAPVNELTVVSLEELQHAVSESQAAGHLHGDAGEMFRRALAFSRRTAGEVARPPDRMDTLALEILDRPDGRELFMDLLVESGRTRVPVTRGSRAVGYVNALDFMAAADTGIHPDVSEMVRPLRRVPPAARAADLLEDFRRSGDPLAILETPDGEMAGLLTMEDLLEQIVGDILDEYDREKLEDRA